MRVVITPAYSISDKLLEVINREGEVTVVITDDVSPIFPIDRREVWIERCSLKRGLSITSIAKCDEDEDWLDDLYAQIPAENIDEMILFYTEYNVTDLSPFKEAYKFDVEEHAPIFTSRFGEEFNKYFTPKQETRDLGDDKINVIPVVDLHSNPRYGLITRYPSELNEVLNIYIPKFASINDRDLLLSHWIIAIFGATSIGGYHVGTIDGVSTFFIEVDKPEWLEDDGVNSNRKYISLDADAVFVDEEAFSVINSVTHMAHDKLKERLKVNEDA